jgi:hypothetical protein
MKSIFYTLILITIVTLSSCGGKGGDNGGSPTPANPEKATLLFPAQNSVCVTGTVLSTTQSTVTLTWQVGTNAENYDVTIKNLLTNATTTQAVSTNKLDVTLSRGTPYSWFVVSKSSKVSATAQTDTWKFYNAGVGVTYYAPFPADLTTPGYSASVTATAGKIDLAWAGGDADNDITAYDVYLGTTTTPALLKAAVTDMFLKQVTVTVGATYYWQVVTNDAQGNTSQSNIYQFTVK